MLMLNPVGGAMFLRSIGMFLQGGRRGSKPQAHSLIHNEQRGLQEKASNKSQLGLTPTLYDPFEGQNCLPEEGQLLSKKKSQKEKKKTKSSMSEEKINTAQLLNKLNPKMVENLKKRTHFTR